MMEERSREWMCRREEACYPEKLKVYKSMPRVLYVRGGLPDPEKPAVAVVGARACSRYGEQQAYRFGKILSENGVQIISGLARGIDGMAHRGALDAGGKTFAVMGCGTDICYPAEHRELYDRMKDGQGGILSEFPGKTPPYGKNFPRRNRIISALADLVLVIEARKRSGSLITASYALEQGKTVYALPGRVGDAVSEGCNLLIADGAGIACSPEMLLEELGISCERKVNFRQNSKIRLASQEEMVYSCLDFQPKNIEEIHQETDLNTRIIAEVLLKLELDGLITEPVKNYYARAGG